MRESSCWGFLGLAVTFGLAAITLPADYSWLQPYLMWAAVACGLLALVLLGWPVLRRLTMSEVENRQQDSKPEPTVGDINIKAGDRNKFGNIGHQINREGKK